MIRFHCPDIAIAPFLPESDSRHAVRVLRLRAGDEVEVIDGKGTLYHCVLADDNQRHAAINIVSAEPLPPVWPQQIAVAVAPTKHMDRMEWLVEKLTEVGVNRIIPMLTARSERREIKRERLEKIAVSAMKQSLKATLPVVDEMMPLGEVLRVMPGASRYVGYCSEQVERHDFSEAYASRRGDSLILIGPEGDFTPGEVEGIIAAGVLPVTFGRNRLRTETAALYAVTAIHAIDALGEKIMPPM